MFAHPWFENNIASRLIHSPTSIARKEAFMAMLSMLLPSMGVFTVKV